MGNYDESDRLVSDKAWEEVYKTLNPVLFGYLARKVGHDLAGDIMQEAFLKLYQVMVSGKKIENIKAYLFQIARNELNSQMNRNYIADSADLLVNLEDHNSNVEAAFLKKELNGLLISAKQTLSHTELEIFELRWFLGFTQIEIAGVLNKSERQIRRNLEKIVRKIRAVFENAGWNAGDVQEAGKNG
jgi:RNA polymerase sigma-70 factor (ECF subfamily)